MSGAIGVSQDLCLLSMKREPFHQNFCIDPELCEHGQSGSDVKTSRDAYIGMTDLYRCDNFSDCAL
jgi:hypothetical protein